MQDSGQIEQQYCIAARSHLDKAEMQADGASFWNIETVQTLILVARYEFTNACAARAILTTGRLMQLLSLLRYDRLDCSTRAGSDSDRFASLAPSVDDPNRLHDVRRAFWIAFSLNCHATANAGGPGAIEIDEVRLS